MEWSPQQNTALRTVDDWFRNGDQQVCRVFGFAGTGKTTLARHFAEGVEGEVLYGALTGKAAYVLRQMGCAKASTIHSMIYHSKQQSQQHLKDLEAELVDILHELRTIDYANDDPEWATERIDENRTIVNLRTKIEGERNNVARPSFTLNHDSDVKDASLLILDEVSMVDAALGQDVLSFGTKVLVLGDPAQLPPVYGSGFFTDHEPDIMLTEIHRQAADNPIIRMATETRHEQSLPLGNYGESRVIEVSGIVADEVVAADQLLVGRNRTRHTYNRRMRELKGIREEMPVRGDRLVCLRNNHDKGLLNGAIWYTEDTGPIDDEKMTLVIRSEDSHLKQEVTAHTHYFIGNEEKLGWWDRKDAEEFDYGYALTAHKSQGSQWDDVIVFDESYCFKRDRWRWLYTAITRAAERVTVVRM